jgi:ribonuclease T2
MLRPLLLSTLLLTLLGCATPALEKTDAARAPTQTKKQRRSRQVRGEAGQFDFYVLALSWSPGYCATPAGQRDQLQCGPQRQFAFVLHGLWPQYEKRGWPQNCNTDRVDETTAQAMLDIMPSPRLVRHEWEKHGTCSGLSAKEYFEESREAFQKVKIPEAYRAPLQQITVDPAQMTQSFEKANPGVGFVVACTNNGRFLQEVRACFTKDLEGRPCNDEVLRGACRSRQIIMRPLR